MKNHESIIGDMADIMAKGWYAGIMTDLEENEWEGRKIISPIEQIFYACWDYFNAQNSRGLGTYIYLEPQKKVGKYYLDFQVDFFASFVNHPVHVPDSKLKELSNSLPLWGIELDGHNFHEKNKSQVEYDKKRERFLVSQGYKIYRFSGSEIFKNAFSCIAEIYSPAEEIIRSATKQIWGIHG